MRSADELEPKETKLVRRITRYGSALAPSHPTPHSPLPERRSRSQHGVTLIEMLVVVTIIALFAALVAPRMINRGAQAKSVAAKAQIEAFQTALGTYKLDSGTYPTNEEGLAALRTKPANATQWNGPYLPQEIPADPWSHPYLYKYPGEHGDEPDIISLGADGQPGGDENNADIVSWKAK